MMTILPRPAVTSVRVRHYGSPAFMPERFKPAQNGTFICKPVGGLWTSPVDSDSGWYDFCLGRDGFAHRLEGGSFDCTIEGRIAIINTELDLDLLIWRTVFSGIEIPDFEATIDHGVDAIWLTSVGQFATRYTLPRHLYGWDVETVLVLNPDAIKL